MRSQHGSARNRQLERILAIVRDLDRLGGVDLYELGERYGAGIRTIRRDLEAIQAAGLPVEGEQDGKRKRFRIAYGDRLAKVTALLDASHFLALRVAMAELGAAAQGSALFATLEDLASKIEGAVGEKGRARLAAIERAFLPWHTQAYARAAKEHLLPLVEAIEARRWCEVRYRAARAGGAEARRHTVLPLKLFVHDRAVYALCRFQGHRGVGTLNLQRLDALTVTRRTGAPPRGFDATRYAESAFGIHPGERPVTYVLRFDAAVAPFIRERVWHPSQRLRDLRGGGVELSFRCGESYEVTSWVASWRHWVEVVRPVRLRASLAELGDWLTALYRREP
jgi:proteasome accessory factor B